MNWEERIKARRLLIGPRQKAWVRVLQSECNKLVLRIYEYPSIKIEILSLQSNYCENHSRCLRTFSRRTSSWTLSRTGNWTGSWTGSGFVTTIATSFTITIFPSFSSIHSIAERFDIIRVCESTLIVINITSCPFLRFKK